MKGALKQIIKDTGLIPVHTSNLKREYPFSTYQVNNVVTNIREQGILQSRDDLTYLTAQPQMVLSINSYSDYEMEAIDEIRELYHYFKYYNDLEEENVVVVHLDDITNRTTLLTDRYEYRYGFDVYIRYVEKIEKENYTIEIGSVNIDHD